MPLNVLTIFPMQTFNNNYIIEDCHHDWEFRSNKYMSNNSNCITCLDENKFINLGNCVSECKNGYYNNTNITSGLSIKTCKWDLENCFICSLESLSNNNSCLTRNKEKGYYPIYGENNNN